MVKDRSEEWGRDDEGGTGKEEELEEKKGSLELEFKLIKDFGLDSGGEGDNEADYGGGCAYWCRSK